MIRLPKMRKITIVSIGAILVIGVVTGILIVRYNAEHPPVRPITQTGETPPFSALLPQGRTISDLGGWQKLTPPHSDPFYVYVDSINGTAVNVSQQPLPENFKKNIDDSVAELAKAYGATTALDADGTKIYIGTSAKGPQSVIFTQDNLLVLIKSQKTLPNDTWKQYIKKLS